MRRFDAADPGFTAAFSAFLDEPRGSPADVDAAVAGIIEGVRTGGLEAVLNYARRFDRAELTAETLRVTPEEIETGVAACAPDVLEAIAFAAGRIRDYHQRQRPADARFTDSAGVELGWRWTALESVGVYVPGGRAAYPSTVLMNAVPAQVAGVDRIAMVTPPGRIEPAVLAAAHEAGVTEIWKLGGAHAVAALAYGAGPIRPVDKIVGPGNAYVTAAKRRLYGVVGIDALAGPSEIVVVVDRRQRPGLDRRRPAVSGRARPRRPVDPDHRRHSLRRRRSSGRWSVSSPALADPGGGGGLMARPRRGDPGRRPGPGSWAWWTLIAPEHVEFCHRPIRSGWRTGCATPARSSSAAIHRRRVGDYVAGSNHVLPTSRAARFSSGLSIYDFLKRTSIARCDPAAFAVLGPHTRVLAEAEGLPAHARSAALRLDAERQVEMGHVRTGRLETGAQPQAAE